MLKDAATLPKTASPGDRLNMVFKGTAITQGAGRAEVTASGMATEMGAIALSVLLQVAVVNLAFLNLAFGTVPLEFRQWLLCAVMASVVLWFSELRKLARFAWDRWGVVPKNGLH